MFGYRSQERWVFGAFALAILYLAYLADRGEFLQVILGYSLAFYGYYYWIEKRRFRNVKRILTQALIIRLLMLFCLPLLSDDYFRFIWDGLVQVRGINPFAMLPTAVPDPDPYMVDLLANMNSPEYYSVYPPVLQWIWHAIAQLVGENTLHQVMLMRTLIILSDVGIILIGAKILKYLGKWEGNIALYALNPIVIVELTGNLHFEGMMIFFTLLGIYLFMRMKDAGKFVLMPLGALALATGVLTKLVLLLTLPAMWRRWGSWQTIAIGLLTIGFMVLGISYFIDEALIHNFAQSLDLYFRNFQFNSSVFGLTKHIASHWIPHYTVETVGPYITGVMVLCVGLVSLIRKSQNYERFFETLLFILSVHLLFASTVHPWYVINLVAVALFTGYRYPMVWSFAVVLSYFMYSNDNIEVWWIIAIEYVVVITYALWEIWKVSHERKVPLNQPS